MSWPCVPPPTKCLFRTCDGAVMERWGAVGEVAVVSNNIANFHIFMYSISMLGCKLSVGSDVTKHGCRTTTSFQWTYHAHFSHLPLPRVKQPVWSVCPAPHVVVLVFADVRPPPPPLHPTP